MLSLIIAYSHKKRFEQVVRMYEENVKLVEKYEIVAGDLKDIVILNSQRNQKLSEDIRTNQYCPAVRLKKVAEGSM